MEYVALEVDKQQFELTEEQLSKVTLQERDPDDDARKYKEERLKRKKIVENYEGLLEEHFSKDYLKHSTKLQAVKTMLRDMDVVFLQDTSD